MATEGTNRNTPSRQAVLTTLLFTDIVGSTALKQRLGDQAAIALIIRHHELLRSLLTQFPNGREIETAGDSFFIQFSRPSDAVKFALLLTQRLGQTNPTSGDPLRDRIGIHLGEVMVEDKTGDQQNRDFFGIQVDTCARVMSLAHGGQILMTRAVFDNARQALKGADLAEVGTLSWVSHGLYAFKGLEEPLEVCEARLAAAGPAVAPASTDKATRASSGAEELVVGWRPAAGEKVRGTPWLLKEKLGEGGFGEAWLGEHEVMKEKRVFKFCFRADRVRALKREVALFRVLREKVADQPHLVKMLDVYLEEPPYYLVEEYVSGKDLQTWCRAQGGFGRISLEARLEIVAQVAEGLQAAHEAGVLHRDIKPGNILMQGKLSDAGARPEEESAPARLLGPVRHKLAERGAATTDGGGARWRETGITLWEIGQHVRAKLADFGIGQVISQEYLAEITRVGVSVTAVSTGLAPAGTHVYMAPEVVAGKGASPRSDVYSLGVVLYQLLVGDFKQPVGTGWEEDIPEDLLREDLHRCLARNPKDRFATATQLAQQLRSYKTRRDEQAQREAEQEERETSAYWRGLICATSIAVILLVAVAGLAIYAWRGTVKGAPWKSRARQETIATRLHDYESALRSGALGRASSTLIELWHFLATSYAKNAKPATYGPGFTLQESEINHYLDRIVPTDSAESRLCSEIVMRLLGILNNQRQALVPTDSLLYERGSTQTYRTPDQRWEIRADGQGVYFKDLKDDTSHFSSDQPRDWLHSAPNMAGKRKATLRNGTLFVKDALDKRTVGALKLGQQTPRGAVFSSDGRHAAVFFVDRQFQTFDAESGKPLSGVITHGLSESAMGEFSPDGRDLLILDSKTIKIWEVSTGAAKTSFVPPSGQMLFAAAGFSRDGRRVIAALRLLDPNAKRSVVILDAVTGHELGGPTPFAHYTESPNGKWLVVYDKDTEVWDLATGKLVAKIPGEPQEFDATGEALLMVYDQAAQVFDLRTGQPLTPPLSLSGSAYAASYSPNYRWIATTSWDSRARIWEASTGQPQTPWLEPPRVSANRPAARPRFSQCNRFLTIMGTDWAGLREVERGAELTVACWHPRLRACHVSPDGRWIVTVNAKSLKVWEVGQLKPGAAQPSLGAGVRQAILSPAEDRVATASGASARVWDIDSSQPVSAEMSHASPIAALCFSPNGQWLATAASNLVQVWEAKSGLPVGRAIPCEGAVARLVFSPTGDALLAAAGKRLAVWDPRTAKPLAPAFEAPGRIQDTCFSPDAVWIAAAAGDKGATLWQWQIGPPEAAPLAQDQEVRSVGFLGTNALFTCSSDAVYVWDVASLRPMASYSVQKPLRSVHLLGGSLVVGVEGTVAWATYGPSGSGWQRLESYATASPSDAVRAVYRSPENVEWLLTRTGDGMLCLAGGGSYLSNRSFYREPFQGVWGWHPSNRLAYPVLVVASYPGVLASAQFSPVYKSRKLLLLGEDRGAQVWPVPFYPQRIPKWFVSLLFAYDPDRSIPALRRQLKGVTARDEFTRWGRWFCRLDDHF